MTQRIQRKADSKPIKFESWDQRWRSPDKGLICAWENGRALRAQEPETAQRALQGELPILGWKGGVDKEIKKKHRYGTLRYLATWRGLRGEDLDIDLDAEVTLTCAKTGMIVTFTPDSEKFATS